MAALCQNAKTRGDWALQWERKGSFNMTDAQVGLALAAPIIVAFAIALRKMGVLQGYSAMSAVVISVAIAAVLFLQQ